MENIHNLDNLNKVSSENESSRLFLILAISALLIGAEVLWVQIRNANFDIDSYSANLSSAVPNRDAFEAARLSAEANSVDLGDLEMDFRSIDGEIESSL